MSMTIRRISIMELTFAVLISLIDCLLNFMFFSAGNMFYGRSCIQKNFSVIVQVVVLLISHFYIPFRDNVDISILNFVEKIICDIVETCNMYFSTLYIEQVKTKHFTKSVLILKLSKSCFPLDVSFYAPI